MKGRALLFVAALGGTVAGTACGSGAPQAGAPVSAMATLRGAPAKTTRDTYRATVIVRLTTPDGSVPVQRMTMSVDPARPAMRMQAVSPSSNGDGSRRDLAVEAVSIGDVTYERLSWVTLPAGKEWFSATRADLGISPDEASSFGSGDPADGFAFLSGIVAPHERGHEDVDGVATTRYDARIDLTRMLEVLAKGATAMSPQFASQLRTLRDSVAVDRLPASVWVDADGRVRRFDYRMQMRRGGETATVSQSMRCSDFGAPVSIEAPPAERVAPFTEVRDIVQRGLAALQQPAA